MEESGKSYATFVTWSDWDLGRQLSGECRRKGIFKPAHMNAWVDLRDVYKKYYKKQPKGLNGAMEERCLVFVGRQHSGIDDAVNTARLLFRLITDGCIVQITTTQSGFLPLFRRDNKRPRLM